ncbi:polysaccharide biosynthesis/export family protein, partial [Bacteroides salyersiae]|uniref:polysaccharide biosynthesis/export family protein n=1 Tax=Bacteroides salyersiae TaxID=291644 RepID=UPI0018980AD2
MRMRFLNKCLLCLLAILTSCSAPKEVLYLQDIASLKEEVIDKNYEVIIHKDDLLAILVNSKDPELAMPFNMPMVSFQIGSTTSGQQRLLGYLVDQNGDIDFPILGKLHVEGLTRMQVTELIKQKLMNEDLI